MEYTLQEVADLLNRMGFSHKKIYLIERLCKFLRKKVNDIGFYRTKEKFRQAIKDFFDNIGFSKEELETFQTLKSQSGNSQFISY